MSDYARLTKTPSKNGDGYSYGSETILTVGEKVSLSFGSSNDEIAEYIKKAINEYAEKGSKTLISTELFNEVVAALEQVNYALERAVCWKPPNSNQREIENKTLEIVKTVIKNLKKETE